MIRPLVLTALLASVLSAPLALSTPASADPDPAHQVTAFVADNDDDGGYGLYVTDNGATTTYVPESDATDVESVAASADGSRLVYQEDLTGSAESGADSHSLIIVRDTGTGTGPHFTRNVADVAGDRAAFDIDPQLSPDGNTVAWTRLSFGKTDEDAPTVAVYTESVAGGTAKKISSTLFGVSFLTNTTLIGADDANQVVTIPVNGGTTHPVTGLGSNFTGEFRTSPDGSKVAWLEDTTGDNDQTSTTLVKTAALSVSADGVATFTGVTTLVTGQENESPSYSRDGNTVFFIRNDGGDGAGDIWSVPAAGGTATEQITTADEIAVAIAGRDSTAPGTAAFTPFTLAGTSATLHWTLPADADLSGVVLSRPGKTVVVAAPLTSYVDTGLSVGQTYAWTVAALDRSSNTSATASRSVTAYQPKLTFFDPTSSGGQNAPFRLTLPKGSYTVQYRTNSTGALATLAQHTGLTYVFSAAHPGYSYGFTIQVSDAYGNSSAVTAAGITEVPYDQTKATFSGTTLTQPKSDRWLGSATLLQKAGSAARIVLNGTRLQIIGERCASCGVMDVYVDGTRVAGIDTHAGARQVRQVLYTRGLTKGNHTVVIKARGTAGRPNVVLDGFGVRH